MFRLPTEKELRRAPGLRWLGRRLKNRRVLWSPDKKPVARGASLGLFLCWIPIPFQMALAVPMAVLFSANVPMAIACVWFSNPLTWLPMLALAYEVGFLILKPPVHYLVEINEAEDFWAAFDLVLVNALEPVLLGTLILQVLTAAAAYGLVIWFWEGGSKLRQSAQD